MKILALLAICFAPFCMLAQEPRVSQYAHRAWLVRDGFFNGAPMAITQTTDGYIWVGTASGLFRFDGSRFESWSSPDGKKLPSNAIGALLGARDGSLWVGVRGGLAHFVDRKLFVYPDFHDDAAGLLEDRSGKIWFTRSEAGGALRTPVCHALPTRIRCLDESDGVTTKVCCPWSLTQDTEGYLWATTEGPLFRWKPGHSETTYMPNEWARTKGIETASAVVAMPDGSVLVGVQHPGDFGGLQRLSVGRWEPVKVPGFNGSKVTAMSAFRDKDGGIWLGTTEGIYHIHGNVFEKFGIEDGLSGDFVIGFYQDRENGIWVATSGGVDYFHPRNVTTFSKREGLASDNVDAVTATHDNAVWLNSGDTLNFLKNGRVDAIRVGHGLPGPTAIFVDSFGRLWSGIDNDLYRYDHGKFQRVRGKGGGSTHFIVGITEDSAHDIWAEVSGGSPKLIRVHDMQVVEEFPEAVIPSARALAAGPNGVLWLGLRNGDLARFHDGHAQVFPSPGGPKSYVYQVVVNPDGTVFATTSAGLVAWKDGTSHLLSSKNGLPCDSVLGAAWDNQDSLWLDTGCGLARISKEDMDRWWRDDTAALTPKILDALDGVVSGGIANFNPMVRTPDGRLWIANTSNVQFVDPSHLTSNDVPPPVHIEKIIADRKPYQPNDKLTFPPLMLDLEIDYAALSFVNPQKVRFRYKLEGRDTAWQEAGNRRQAFYTDLPPRSYRFRVIACNDDGLWNEEGAAIAFSIAPAWYQTTAFRISCLLGSVFLLWLLYYLRMKQASRSIRARFDERIAERTQIARNLHDTLLQTIQGCKLVADQARSDLSDSAKTEGYLSRLSDWLDRASLEGRAALESIRIANSGSGDLAGSIRAGIEELQTKCGLTISLSVQGAPSKIHPVVRQEIFLIVYEAIGNACRHSGGRTITVQLSYEGSLSLRIRDDGQGVDEQTLKAGKAGHFGLAGMRERAQRINATLKIWSDPGKGTEVVLIVPGKMIFEASQRSAGSLFQKLISRSRRPHSQRVPSEDEY